MRELFIGLVISLIITIGSLGILQQSDNIDVLLRGVESEGVVTGKTSEQSILLGSKYYVYVRAKNSDGKIQTFDFPTRVSKKQFFQLEVNDRIDGSIVNGDYFYTTYGQWIDRFKVLLVFMTVNVVLWLYITGYLQHRKEEKLAKKSRKRTKRKRLKKKMPRDTRNKEGSFDSGFAMMMFIGFCAFILCIYISTFYIMNGYYKFLSKDKEKTVATIVDHDRHCYIRYKLYVEEPFWQRYTCNNEVDLLFFDDKGSEINIKKKILTGAYDVLRYEKTVEIEYLRNNPYKVYLTDRTFGEAVSIYGTGDVAFIIFIYPISIGVSGFFLVHSFRRIKKYILKK